MTTDVLSTRARAARTLGRVTDHGAYSNVLMSHDRNLATGDHALYQRLVYEALRYLPAIDEAIARAGSRGIDRIQPEVLAVLRIATGEVRYLHRHPHSAVSEAVDAVRQLGRAKASGFVNGVLRTIVREIDLAVPSDRTLGMPEWLYGELGSIFGSEVDEFVNASNTPARTGIRSRDGIVRGEPSQVWGATYATDETDLAALVAEGSIEIIDPASVAVVNALNLGHGNHVVDLAAAPGGKTRLIGERIGAGGRLVASDKHFRRLKTTRQRSRASLPTSWVLSDAAQPAFRSKSFDRVLLDAPCTGLGTLRRRPEIRQRIDKDSPKRYGMAQRLMLESALRLVGSGGRLVYSVCTVFPQETVDVVAGLGGHQPENVPGVEWGDGLLLTPHTTRTDGMFIAAFDR